MTWQQVNLSPIIPALSSDPKNNSFSFPDSLPSNQIKYAYRVIGKTFLGTESLPSDSIQVQGKDGPLSFIFGIASIEELTPGTQTLSWTFPDSLVEKMRHFEVWRAGNMHGPYTKINTSLLPVSSRTFTDVQPLAANYYVLKAIDTLDYVYSTFPSLGQPKDEIPPQAPVIISATADRTGLVTIKWARNTEPDMMGYRVFVSTAIEGDYGQVTSTWINDTVYHHQINLQTLSEHIYFGVSALDHRQNTSQMSAPVQVKIPDIIPPAAPIISGVTASTTGVTLRWKLSSSTDVESYELQRRNLVGPAWAKLHTFLHEDNIFYYIDNSADSRSRYEYRLIAIDGAGLRTSSNIIQIKPIDSGLRHAISYFVGQYQALSRSTTLQWRYTNDPDLIGFQIFRAIQDSANMRSYAFVPILLPADNVLDISGFDAQLSGNTWLVTFVDRELDFTKTQIKTFTSLSVGSQVVPNTSVPGPLPGSNTYVTPNPNNLAGKPVTQPTQIFYWVMAKYADGAVSPLKGALLIQL